MKGSSRVGIAAFAAAVALFAAGCSSSDSDPADSGAVVNPPAGATIGSSGDTTAAPTTAATTAPATAAPTTAAPTTAAPTTAAPTTAAPSATSAPTTASGPAARYAAIVGQWQTAQSRFLLHTTSGSANLSREHQWAATFLAAERRFAAALVPSRWPSAAAGSLARVRRASTQQQRTLRAMTRAAGPSDFTSRLGNYSTTVGAENRDVRSVSRALGR